MTIIAFEHFAGVGISLALKQLGVESSGVENAPSAIATRELHGFATPYYDVWDGLFDDSLVPPHHLYTAGPPCQPFSQAGSGVGRRNLGALSEAIEDGDYRDPHRVHQIGEETDVKAGLVLVPLAHIYAHLPEFVMLEQVPSILPVWELYAAEMQKMGYGVWTGILEAERFGVPQTRRRAYLIAAMGREVTPPRATHSRYYTHSPAKRDLGVLPWVSMAEALGWGMSERPSPTVTGGGTLTGGAEPIAHLRRYMGRTDWVLRSNYGTSGDKDNRGERRIDQPAATITSKANRNLWQNDGGTVDRLSISDAGVLQSFPAGFGFAGNANERFLQVGNSVPPLLAKTVISNLVR